jgi:type I restriction enzyme, S subunit
VSRRDRWQRVRFGDVVRNVSESVADPLAAGLERAVGLEHLEPGELAITRWASTSDGLTFTRRFNAGQVLFGRRRVYQRKVAVPGFDGVCSGDIYVLEPSNDGLLQELLPFIVQSEPFFEYALRTSAGSLSPRTKWTDLKEYTFDLPPNDEQRDIAELLLAAETICRAWVALQIAVQRAGNTHREDFLTRHVDGQVVPLNDLVDPSRPICYGILKPGAEHDDGIPVVDVKDYPDGVIHLEGMRRTDPLIESEFRRSRLKTGDVLMSIRGTIGRVAEVPAELEGGNISRDSARISLREGVDRTYVRKVLESEFVQRQVRTTTTGLAVKGINIAKLREVLVPLPPRSAQQHIVSTLGAIEVARGLSRDSLRTGRELRTTLLRACLTRP